MSQPRESIKFAQKYFNGKTNTIVEVGVGDATHACRMYNTLNPKQMYLIDPFFPPDDWPETDKLPAINEGSRNKRKVEIICKRYDNLILIPKESHLAISDVPNGLDLVYIDAIHDSFNVRRDIKSWFPKIRIGGIICGHDFHDGRVKSAVEKIFPNVRLRIDNIEGSCIRWNKDRYFNAEGNDWWLVKKSEDLNNTAEWMK